MTNDYTDEQEVSILTGKWKEKKNQRSVTVIHIDNRSTVKYICSTAMGNQFCSIADFLSKHERYT